MKRFLLLASILALSACKEQPEQDESDTVPAPKHDTRPMIESVGCTATKLHGVVTVNCADGSNAQFGTPALHIKDGNGVSLDNLIFITTFTGFNQVVLNKTSGNVLVYDGTGGLTSVNKTFWDGPNCTGNAYAQISGAVIKNRVFLNGDAWPGGAQAIKLVGFSYGSLPMQSYFQAGACTSSVAPQQIISQVVASTFDSSDPMSLVQPIEVVSE